MTMNPFTRSLACVCAVCPLCVAKRRFPRSGYARFMRRIERACPFCKAYAAVHRADGGAESTPPARE